VHQITLWTALELEEGLGASLQHSRFVPGVEDGIRAAFDIPSTWSVRAEIVFGALSGERPAEPEKEDISTTVKIYKSSM
jgi:predicted oxidoreductase (fatty acid repression mutant protein)